MTAWDCKAIFGLYDQLRHFYTDGMAREFLSTPQAGLGDRRPCELIENPHGYQRVKTLIDQLESGAFV